MRKLWEAIAKNLDLEMIQRGWWMLLLIMGTIAMMFVICTVLIRMRGGAL